MGKEFIDSYAQYIKGLPKYVPFKPERLNGRNSEINEPTIVVLLSLLYASGMKLSNIQPIEGYKSPKEKFANKIDKRLQTGPFAQIATYEHWESEELAKAVQIGDQVVSQLSGNLDCKKDIRLDGIPRNCTVLLWRILRDSALELPGTARKEFADSLEQSINRDNHVLVAFQKELNYVDYTYIENWVKRYAESLRKPSLYFL